MLLSLVDDDELEPTERKLLGLAVRCIILNRCSGKSVSSLCRMDMCKMVMDKNNKKKNNSEEVTLIGAEKNENKNNKIWKKYAGSYDQIFMDNLLTPVAF